MTSTALSSALTPLTGAPGATTAPSGSATAAGTPFPAHLTRFVGRDRELGELARLLGQTRLLTLTGAGGSGKTRLAREVAAQAAASFARIAWADLAPLADPAMVAHEVAAALHVPERGPSPVEATVRTVGATPTLLVLDNCEHVVDACAEVVERLLRGCPSLTVLATSREALSIPSETAWLVPPLAGGEAVQLFAERARAALPSFALGEGNADAVREICRRLDGIPLAIELAAARVRVLSPEQIAERLTDALRLLTAGSRTALPRHRTLRGTLDWSYRLLSGREQALLQRLSVFSGSFSLEAAEAVCAGAPLEPEDILDGVAALVDKSLVVMESGETGAARYRMLETVRQYGAEQAESGAGASALDAYRERHARHFLALAEHYDPHLVGGEDEPGLVARIAADHDNLRAAGAWAVADRSRAEEALRFAGSFFWYCYGLGHFREARQLMDQALALAGDGDGISAPIRSRALAAAGLTALAQGDYARSQGYFEAGLPLVRAAGDVPLLAVMLSKLGAARMLAGDLAGAESVLDEARELVKQMPVSMVAVFAAFWRAWAAYLRGDLDLAYATMEPNFQIGRQLRHRSIIGHAAAMFGRIEFARGNTDAACSMLAESITLETQIGDGWGLALAADAVAVIALARGRHDTAARLFAGLEAHRERLSIALPGVGRAEECAGVMATLRAALGADFDRAWAAGRALTTAEVASLALAEATRECPPAAPAAPAAAAAAPIADAPTPPPAPAPQPAARGRATLRVQALGPLQVHVGDDLIDVTAWGSARPRELLVYLLMHPEGRTKEQVGLALWPEASTAQLRNSFHVTLHRLRKALRTPEWITLTGDRYRVDPAAVREFDVAEFEREVAAARRALRQRADGASAALERALSRFHGDFLDGEPVGDWHLEHRDRLQRLYVDSLVELGGRLADEERWEKAADAYRRVLARDDLHEEATRALMLCHARLGERAQALRLYQRFAERLRAELDAEPDEETAELHERVRRG